MEQSGYSRAAAERFPGVLPGWLTGHIMMEDQEITGELVSARIYDMSSDTSVVAPTPWRMLSGSRPPLWMTTMMAEAWGTLFTDGSSMIPGTAASNSGPNDRIHNKNTVCDNP